MFFIAISNWKSFFCIFLEKEFLMLSQSPDKWEVIFNNINWKSREQIFEKKKVLGTVFLLVWRATIFHNLSPLCSFFLSFSFPPDFWYYILCLLTLPLFVIFVHIFPCFCIVRSLAFKVKRIKFLYFNQLPPHRRKTRSHNRLIVPSHANCNRKLGFGPKYFAPIDLF